MRFAIRCTLASNVNQKRLDLRSSHLKFLEANKEQIYCGGPIVDLDGQPEMMLIILNTLNRSSAEAFIKVEPYNQSGIFERVTISEWRQVLPEAKPGGLLRAIKSEE